MARKDLRNRASPVDRAHMKRPFKEYFPAMWGAFTAFNFKDKLGTSTVLLMMRSQIVSVYLDHTVQTVLGTTWQRYSIKNMLIFQRTSCCNI